MSTEENKAIVRRVYDEVINQGNFAVADELFSSIFVYRAPGSPEFRGPEGFKQLIAMYRAAFPDLHLTVEEVLAEGGTVVSRYTARGTHRGDLMGIPPSGKQVAIPGIVISRFADDKVVEDFEILDHLGMLQQLGVATIPGPQLLVRMLVRQAKKLRARARAAG